MTNNINGTHNNHNMNNNNFNKENVEDRVRLEVIFIFIFFSITFINIHSKTFLQALFIESLSSLITRLYSYGIMVTIFIYIHAGKTEIHTRQIQT